jgi:Squalene-hopene cyclase C-terminal domain
MLNLSPVICWALLLGSTEGPSDPSPAEVKAVAFLSAEVPRWSRDNHCYSCHNNGDAARALYRASTSGIRVPQAALAETTRWLIGPGDWDHNGGDGPFNDKRLARVVFTATLDTAVATRWVQDRSAFLLAAQRLVLDQAADGSWLLEGDDAPGSPATYGRPLATFLARQALFSADAGRFRTAIDRADGWLSSREILTITDASVCLLGGAKLPSPSHTVRYKRSLELLRRGQSADGGWGPRASSAPEPFDTALALLALAKCDTSREVRGMIVRGRGFLIAEQQQDGSWVETTRPPGNVSYAQRISTTGWATLALLSTREPLASDGVDSKR